MEGDITFRYAEDEDLTQVRNLMVKNLSCNISANEKRENGFVSLNLDIPFLNKVSRDLGIVVAEEQGVVVGYEFMLTIERALEIPFLAPFIQRTSLCEHCGMKISDYKSLLGGQICVDSAYRGRHVAEGLHKKALERMNPEEWEILFSGISTQNLRSIKFSEKLGWKVVDNLQVNGNSWLVLVEDLRKLEGSADKTTNI